MSIESAERLQSLADQLINSTRSYIYIRPEDGLIILRPNRLHYLNKTAVFELQTLYDDPDGPNTEKVVQLVCERYGAEPNQVREDLEKLLYSLSALLNDDISMAPSAHIMRFGSHNRQLPVLSEVALTYNCQNKCTFCYADAPKRGSELPEMTTEQVKVIIDRIYDEAHCPTLSFTGGEPTLRKDLPELIRYAKGKGLRVNLITNGVKLADMAFVQSLADAGLDSAQVSIEGGSAEVHDAITRNPGSWAKATQGVKNLRACNIHAHTNTTICGRNRDHLQELVEFAAKELGSSYFSMNMVIRTGTALRHDEDDMSYESMAPIIKDVQRFADEANIHFEWYSPVPYCMFNPVQAGLGSKSCACVDGLLSVNPAGQLIPCSSFGQGIGDLLNEPFEKVWNSRTALYWRRKEFMPPMCQKCEISDICCGACPLYWEQRGCFDELEPYAPGGKLFSNALWRLRKRLWSGTHGVGL